MMIIALGPPRSRTTPPPGVALSKLDDDVDYDQQERDGEPSVQNRWLNQIAGKGLHDGRH